LFVKDHRSIINPTIPTKAPTGTVIPCAPPVFRLGLGLGLELPDVCDPPDFEFEFKGGADPVGVELPVLEAPLVGKLGGLREPDTLADTAGAEPPEMALGRVPAGELVPAGPDPVAELKRAVPVSQVMEPLQPSPGAGVPSQVHVDWVN
jgi:hypothetical protein